MKEHEIAKYVITYFESIRYESYKEVVETRGSRRADMVFKKNNEIIVVESKLNMGMHVIEQAYNWKSSYNIMKAYVAIPKPKRKRNYFAEKVCQDYGIGIIEVDKIGNVYIRLESIVNNNETDDLDITLYEQQKDSVAGTKGGDYVTPFKLTREKIYKELEKGEMKLATLVENIEHHYSNNNSAKKCISEMCKIGVINANIKTKGKIKYISII